MGAVKKALENSVLRRLIPLSSLSPAGLDEVAHKVVMEEIPAGQYVFRVGDEDNQLIYLLQGKLNLMVENEVLDTVAAGSDAARSAIAPEHPRQVSARAKTPVSVARIDTNLVDMLLNWGESSGYEVADIGSQDGEDWISRLLQTEIFGRLPPSNIQQLLRRIEPVPVEEGKVVIHQGDDGDYFYIIKKGRCVVSRKPSERAKSVKLAELGGGDTFGEEALLSKSKRNATVTMATAGCLMRLAKQDFVELLQGSLVTEVDYIEARRLVREQSATWLDVRSPEDVRDNVLEDSINLPLSRLRDKAHELDAKGLYILCCDHGRQSANAAFLLGQLGFAVRVLQGGLESISMPALGEAAADHIELKAVEGDGLEQTFSISQATESDTQQVPVGNDKTAARPSAEVVANITEAETTALHAKLRAIRAGHELAVKKINQRVVLLEQALEQVQEQEQEAVQSSRRSEVKLRALEQKLDAAYLEVEQRTQQLQVSQQALDRGQQESEDLRQKLGESQQRLATSQADHLQQQDVESKLAMDRQRADAEIAALAQQLAMAKAEHNSSLDEAGERLQELQGAMLSKEKLGDELARQRQRSESDVGDLRQQVLVLQEQAERAQQEWRNQRTTFQAQQDSLQDQLKLLESERDQSRLEQNSITTALEQGKGQLKRLKRQLDAANDQNQEQQWQEERAALEQQQAELEEQWKVSQDQAQSLEVRCKELEQARDIAVSESGKHKESLVLLREQLSSTESSSEDEVQSLWKQLQDLQKQLDTATQEHEEALGRWEKGAADREEEHASNCAQLEAAQQALKAQAEEAQIALQAVQQEAQQLRTSLQESNEKIDSLEQQSDKQRLDLDSGQKQFEDALQRLQLAQEQRVTAQRQYAELQASLADTQEVSQKERVRWQQQLDDAFIERDGIKTCLQESEASRRDIDSHAEELEQQLAKVNKGLTDAQRRLAEEQENGLQMREQMESEAAQTHELTDKLEEVRKLRDQDATQGREREEVLTAQLETVTKQDEHTRDQFVKAQEQAEARAEEQDHQLVEISKDLAEAQRRLHEEQESVLQIRETVESEVTRVHRLTEELDETQRQLNEEQKNVLQMREQMESEVSRVRVSAEELEKARQQQDQASTEARQREEALMEQLDALTKRSERSLTELAAARQLETEQNQQQIEALKKKWQETGEKLATANSNEKELNALSGRLEQERDVARSDKKQLNTELDRLRDELEETRRQGKHQCAELTESLQKLQQQSTDDDAERERQQSELKARSEVSQQQFQDLEKDCNQLREERDATQSRLDDESQELEGLRQRVVALEAEGKGDFLVLRAQAETAKEQARRTMKEMEQKSMEYRSMQVELGMRQDQEAALRAEIETVKAREVKLAAKLRGQMLEDGTEPVFDDEDPGDRIEDQLREQVEQLQTELDAATESLSTADIDLQVREQVLQSELDEMLNQANSEIKEVTQQLEDAQQQLESAEQEYSKEDIGSGEETGPESVENQAPGDAQASAQGPTAAIPEQVGAFEYIKDETRSWSRRLSIGGMLVVGVGLVVLFLVRSGGGVMVPAQKDSVPAGQELLVDSNTLPATINKTKSAANEVASAIQLPEQGVQGKDIKANLSSGLNELMGKAEVKITRLRNLLIQNTQVTDEMKQLEPDQKPTAATKSTGKKSAPLRSTAMRATRVTRGREIQDKLSSDSVGPVLVQLPHGSFGMGGSDSSPNFDERPQHPVRVREFAIGKYEVTFAEYDRFAEFTGRELPKDQGWGRGDQPVINISWHDAVAYTRWLSKQTGYQYRLPSEAEWEYAARAGTISPHWWDTLPPDANCFDCGGSWAGLKVAPVGRFRANPFGLHDTAGNAAEWTQDCYYPNYKDAPNDGSARLKSGCKHRVVRGGNYSTPLNSVRSTKRVKQSADSKLDTLGFRVVREP